MQPASYWRNQKNWSKWIGKVGTVITSTVVRVSAPDQSTQTPYSYVLVDFGDEKYSFMGAGHEIFVAGDQVKCIFRKTGTPGDQALVPYGIKVTKV